MRPLLLPRPTNMNWAHVYKELAAETDIHAITQRPDAAKTTLIARNAKGRLPEAKSVLDIGCGDGQLLRSINAEVRVGTVISEEEAQRLRANYQGSGMEFYAANIETLSTDRKFDLISVVGVFQLLTSRKSARKALLSISRMVNDGGHVYIGDFIQVGITPKRHHSTIRAIGFVRRTSGIKVTLGFLVHLWKRRHRMGYYEAPRLPQYAASADDFIALARECGLEIVEKWDCANFGTDDRRARVDFLFRAVYMLSARLMQWGSLFVLPHAVGVA